MRAGRLTEASDHFEQALAIRTEALPEDSWQIANARSLLAAAYTRLRRYEEAEALLLAAHESFEANDDPADASIIAIRGPEARERLVSLYEAWGRPEEAQRFRRD